MPQDKRLIVTRAVLHKLRRECHNNEDEAAREGLFLEFVLPSVVLSQVPEFASDRMFHLPHRTYARDGRTTCLIVPKVIAHDCLKINKRHGYYDAIVTAEAICRRGDLESAKRADKVAKAFSHFVVDGRIVGKLPHCILEAVRNAGPAAAGGAPSPPPSSGEVEGGCPMKCLTALSGLDERASLSFRLSQGALGGVLQKKRQGQMLFRVGHGAMNAGEVCENAKTFIFAVKKDFPTVWKYIHEFKLTSNKTSSLRFMEIQIQR